jgi:ABC-type uncharacterized transport system auxiliary subunit
MKNHKILLITVGFIFIGLFCSCSIKKDHSQPIAYYTLDYENPNLVPQPKLPVTLSIEKFQASSPYNSNRIVYSQNRYSQNKYFYHQWMATPDEMVSNLLARDLTASNLFHAVVHSNDPLTSHLLRGTIDEFYEQDTDNQWNAVLSITIILINKNKREKAGQFVFQKNYKMVYPLEEKNPKGLTRALSRALSEISSLIISDVYNALQSCP